MSDISDKTEFGRKIGYARCSTKEQNIDAQLIALEKAGCERVFTDIGISGRIFPRKGLSEALAVMQAGDTLVVQRQDRVGRVAIELLKLRAWLEERDMRFCSLTQSMDINTSGGKLNYTIFAGISEHESDINAERTKGGIAARKARGVRLGRPPCLSAAQIAAVCKMVEANTMSMAAIARTFGVSHNTIKRAVNGDRGSNAK